MEKVPRGAGKREIKRISLLRATTQENSGIPRARGHCFILCQQFGHQERHGNRNDPRWPFHHRLALINTYSGKQHLLSWRAMDDWNVLSKGQGSMKGKELRGYGTVFHLKLQDAPFEVWELFAIQSIQKVSVMLGSHRHLLPSPLPSNHVLKALGKKICLLPTQLICITHSWK